MQNILDHKGRAYVPPVENKKADAPKTGNAFGAWAGRDLDHMVLPGGGVVQFDLTKLTLADFRNMRDHYQVNASLSVLSFMQHQADWTIECEDEKVAEFCEEQIRNNWTGLNRALSQANWAGYSPAVLEWENEGNRVILAKIKDLVPEECDVNWANEEGWAPPGRTPPKFKKYDGIQQFGMQWPIPVENTLWYPLLMENGDYYGRKLLRPAFTSWFFSILLHLFSNRYFERFGEPVPIGRAPFDDVVDLNGENVKGNAYMLQLLKDLRNRAVVVLPSDKNTGSDNAPDYDYDIEYLESQMRGADFERYMTRLDEEISIGLFTPILLMRTSDVGSYNLGTSHMQMYLWMLNAMNDDRKVYIDKYLLSKMVDYNFGPNAPRAKIAYRKLGNTNAEMLSAMVAAMIQNGLAKPDIEELGKAAGMTLHEIKQTVAPAADPGTEDDPDDPDAGDAGGNGDKGDVAGESARTTVKEVMARLRPQVESAFADKSFGPGLTLNMGYKNKMARALNDAGVVSPADKADRIYNQMDHWVSEVVGFGTNEFGDDPNIFLSFMEQVLETRVKHALEA